MNLRDERSVRNEENDNRRPFGAGWHMVNLAAQAGLVQGTKSKGESEAVIALMTAANSGNDRAIIKAADDLVTKYADTTFKESALYLEATAYDRKHDNDKAQIYCERVLDLNPKNYQASGMLGEILVVGDARKRSG